MTREEAIEYLVSINEEFKKLGFNRQLTTAIETLTSNPWHKASEELPEETCEVLICWETVNHERKWTQLAMFCEHADTGCGRFEDEDGYAKEPDYWMPIPEIKED